MRGKKKLQNQFLSRITPCHQPKTREERRGCQDRPDQSFWEQRLCHLYSNCSLSPSCFMAASLASKPLYDRHCDVFRVLGSLWLGHAGLLSGSEWQWDQVQPPPRTQSHKSSRWHRAMLPEQLPVPAGDKKAFVGFRQPELLHSLRILRFMSDAEKDCERKDAHTLFLSLSLSPFNKAMTKLQLIATECEHLLNSRSWSDRHLFVYICHHGNFPLPLLH